MPRALSPLFGALSVLSLGLAGGAFAREQPGLLLSPPPGAAEATAEVRTSAGRQGRRPAAGSWRWRELPIRVFFDTGGAYTEARRELALDSFDEWAAATGGAVEYALTDSERDADVVVRFSPDSFLRPGRGTVGRTTVAARGGWLRRARIELAVGGVRFPQELVEVAAHEFGHALGLDGHSDEPSDLMFPSTTRYLNPRPDFRPRQKRPTERDVDALRSLYRGRLAERTATAYGR